MKKFAFFAAFAALSINFANADIIDDNVIKAQKSVEAANKKLAAAKMCQANRVTCLADMQAKAQKALERAQKKLAAITAE